MKQRKAIQTKKVAERLTRGFITTGDTALTRENSIGQTKTLFARFFCVFDCIWSFFLLLLIFVILLSVFPSSRNFLYGYFREYTYNIYRYTRLMFTVLNPYLLYAGLDLAKLCLFQNPFANDFNRCPCIDQPHPIVVPVNHASLPITVYENHHNFYILRNAILIQHKQYFGRQALMEYLASYNRLPGICFSSHSGSDGPLRLQQITEELYWNRWKQSNASWDFSWVECIDDKTVPLFRNLMPALDPLFKGHNTVISRSSQFSFSTQWGKSVPHDFSGHEKTAGKVMMIVLQGTIRLLVAVHTNCLIYCHSVYRGSLMYPGDALIYDERYWSYTSQTWSNMSFIMQTRVTL